MVDFLQDNHDLRRRLETAPWTRVIPPLEQQRADADALELVRRCLATVGRLAGELAAAPLDRDALRRVRHAGLFGATLPREVGGLNLPCLAYGAVVEMLARAHAPLAARVARQAGAESCARWGSLESNGPLLTRLAAGDLLAGRARDGPWLDATETAAGWRVTGRVLAERDATLLFVPARATGAKHPRLFAIERDARAADEPVPSDLLDVVNLRDAPAHLAGRGGAATWMSTFTRFETAAAALGLAQAMQVVAVRALATPTPPVRTRLFEATARLEAARAVVFTAAASLDRARGLARAGGGVDLERVERIAALLADLAAAAAGSAARHVRTTIRAVFGADAPSLLPPGARYLPAIEPPPSALFEGGLPLLFEEPLRDATEPASCAGALGALRASYETVVEAADQARRDEAYARQGWGSAFVDATIDLLAALVFLRDAATEERSAVLAQHRVARGRRHADMLLRAVRDGDRIAFDVDTFDAVMRSYRSET